LDYENKIKRFVFYFPLLSGLKFRKGAKSEKLGHNKKKETILSQSPVWLP
jgi:hypothetical protein